MRFLLVQLLALISKELRQIRADPRLVRLLVAAPVLQLLVFGTAVEFDIDRVPTAVVDEDRTSTSRRHAEELLADGTLIRAASPGSTAEALAAMDAGDVAAVVVLPAGLDAARLRGRPAPVQVILDGTDVRRSTVASSAAARYFAQVDAPPPAIRLVPRILSNPSLATQPYMVPGLAAMVLVITTTLVTAMGLAREREVGTLEQILVSPIGAPVLLAGKVLPYAAIGLLDTGLALGAGTLVFDVPMRGSLVFLAFATALYLLSTLGAGLLVATVAKTQQQAFMGGFFFMIPAILLSGNMTPIVAMPEWMVPVTWINPLRWYIEILRANLLEGSGLSELWRHALMLLLIGTAMFGTALRRFRTKLG